MCFSISIDHIPAFQESPGNAFYPFAVLMLSYFKKTLKTKQINELNEKLTPIQIAIKGNSYINSLIKLE
jgi:drug/metabolite transporter (DMT)-like permease